MSLYIVATPIGNLDDITFRAVEILKTVDVILAEDTRHSKRLMNHYDIATPMRAFHEHNETQKSAAMINELLAGKTMALISAMVFPANNSLIIAADFWASLCS